MAVSISGTLTDGAGRPVSACSITLKALRTSSTVIRNVQAVIAPQNNGCYRIEAEPGRYQVMLGVEGYPSFVAGEIVVYADSQPGTLNDFLTQPTEDDLRPEVIRHFEEMVAEVQKLADQVQTDATAVESDMQTAVTAAQEASVSEKAASASEQAAAISEANAAKSADVASDAEKNAAGSAAAASASEQAAAGSAADAGISASAALDSEKKAAISEENARQSEEEAKKAAAEAGGITSVITDGKSILGDGVTTPLSMPFWQPENRASVIYDLTKPFEVQGDIARKSINWADQRFYTAMSFYYGADSASSLSPAFFTFYNPGKCWLYIFLWLSDDMVTEYLTGSGSPRPEALHSYDDATWLARKMNPSDPTQGRADVLSQLTTFVSQNDQGRYPVTGVTVNVLKTGMPDRSAPQTDEALQQIRDKFPALINNWMTTVGAKGIDVVDNGDNSFTLSCPSFGAEGNLWQVICTSCNKWVEESRTSTQINWKKTNRQPGWRVTGKCSTDLDYDPNTSGYWSENQRMTGGLPINTDFFPQPTSTQAGLVYALTAAEDVWPASVPANPGQTAVTVSWLMRYPPLNYFSGNYDQCAIGGIVLAGTTKRVTRAGLCAGADLIQITLGFDAANPSGILVGSSGPGYNDFPGTYKCLSAESSNTPPDGATGFVGLFVRVA